jgi:2-haloacid dehalogenase
MTSSVFAFDAYGTVFDVHAAINRHRDRIGPDAVRVSELWRTKQLEYTWTLTLAGRYLDFWALTEQALDHAIACFPSVDKALKPKLLEAYLKLDPFPEALVALDALQKRKVHTAILSNGSPFMLTQALEAAGLDGVIEAVLSVDAIHLYKPHPDVYRLVTHAFDVTPADVVFVSSNRWDVMGAASFGFRTAWINRTKKPDEYGELPPSVVLEDLRKVVGLIT